MSNKTDRPFGSRVLPNDEFGVLTALSLTRSGHPRYWLCRCICGVEKEIKQSHLVSGGTRSCGCKRLEAIGNAVKTHGKSKTAEYSIWCGIINRCTNPNDHRSYSRYGAKGITICERWRNSFEAFLEDMGPRPSPKHSIDRYPNHRGNYEPDNCRWATWQEQQRNRSDTSMVVMDGRPIAIADLADQVGIKRATLYRRIRLMGWSVEKAIATPVMTHSQCASLSRRRA